MLEYKTINKEANAELIERRSRFIGYICPVVTEEQAIEFINKIRKKHSDATHNVYAYLIRDGQKQRYSDDGEPQGTAGIPALEVLLREGVTDCVVVITRYFGGVLLGAGGLVRAYAHSAKIALDEGGILTMSNCFVCKVSCDYSQYGILQNVLSEFKSVIIQSNFNENIDCSFYVPSHIYDSLQKDLTEKTAGTVKISVFDEKYMPIQ